MPWFAYLIIVVVLLLVASRMYARRGGNVRARGDSSSRGRGNLEYDGSGRDRKMRYGPGNM